MTYSERARFCKNSLAKNLLILLDQKQSNLALSADVIHCDMLLQLADKLGPEICVLKTHIDILVDFTPACITQLTALAKKHRFFIFEDRKFADIGNTVKQQFAGGIYHIAEWANIINAHSLPGPGIIKGLAEIGLSKPCGLLLLAEMSSEKNLFSLEYTEKTLCLADQFSDFVIGFIAQKKLSAQPHWIYFTPGVQLTSGYDALGQQYITPEQAIACQGSDIIIVGRGILQTNDPVVAAREYRTAGWKAYKDKTE